VTCAQALSVGHGLWQAPSTKTPLPPVRHRVVAYDFGIKARDSCAVCGRARARHSGASRHAARDVLGMKPTASFCPTSGRSRGRLLLPWRPAANCAEAASPSSDLPGPPDPGLAWRKTYKLKFATTAPTHPVMGPFHAQVEITSQNPWVRGGRGLAAGQGGAVAYQPERPDGRRHAPRPATIFSVQ